MRFFSSLDAGDRRLLLWCLGIGLALAVLTGFLLPNGNSNSNPLPSTYLSGQHGARAAYETLLRSNYPMNAGSARSLSWPPRRVRKRW